jgi:TolB protein
LKYILLLLITLNISYAGDSTIEVVKKVDSLPSLACEDSSVDYDKTFKMTFFKSIIADLNVISIFNVDRHYNTIDYSASNVVVNNKDMDYVLRYKLVQGDDNSLNVRMKLFSHSKLVFNKNYKINNTKIYMFMAHTIAYDINKFMGKPSVEWMKKKVIFSRVIKKRKTEIVIADYTLAYQHTIVKGGFNVFPKWANSKQNSFYYTSLDEIKPTLKYINMLNGSIKIIATSDGMLICSDVSSNGEKLLLTMAPNGQPDIYMLNIRTREYKKLTRYRGIDVNAQFMNNNKIAFVSDRIGYPNIFLKDLSTGVVEQMIYYGKSNSACSTSNGYVVYKARESSNAYSSNTFNLHLVSTQTDFIRRLTVTGVNEFPRFSQDGDAIIFIKNYKSQSSIGLIRLNQNKNYLFPLKYGKIQSMDW